MLQATINKERYSTVRKTGILKQVFIFFLSKHQQLRIVHLQYKNKVV